MAAARRYAIADYDRTGFARTMYTRPFVATFIAVALAAFFALFMYAAHGAQGAGSLDIFGFIPEELIHDLGIVVVAIVFFAGLAGIVTMARRLGRAGGVTVRSVVGSRAALRRSFGALWSALAVESLGQRRYRADCDADAGNSCPGIRRALVHPRRDDVGLPRVCWPRRSSTTGWPSSASRPPARPFRSGTPSACSAPSPDSSWSTARACSSSSASAASSDPSGTLLPPTGPSWP